MSTSRGKSPVFRRTPSAKSQKIARGNHKIIKKSHANIRRITKSLRNYFKIAQNNQWRSRNHKENHRKKSSDFKIKISPKLFYEVICPSVSMVGYETPNIWPYFKNSSNFSILACWVFEQYENGKSRYRTEVKWPLRCHHSRIFIDTSWSYVSKCFVVNFIFFTIIIRDVFKSYRQNNLYGNFVYHTICDVSWNICVNFTIYKRNAIDFFVDVIVKLYIPCDTNEICR